MDSLDASDDEIADRLDVLASGTAAGGPLEVPLAEMAEAFRRGDTSIPETVTPICLGEAPTTAGGEESDDRERYLSGVRAAAPDIADSDSDLITAIELGCDTLGLAEDNGRPPSNRDQLLASAWAPLDEMDHAEHVLRVGVPIFCPDHAELVTRLLG